jgi:hypothetical protein
LVNLISLADTSSINYNFYADQAQSITESSYGPGICPGYYDHFRADLSERFIRFTKPVRKADPKDPTRPAPISPFTPDDHDLTDIDGNTINHDFLAVRGIPIGYFIGASLSNYEQALPGESPYGGHCNTIKAAITLNEDTTVEVSGKYPIQSSMGIQYSFADYQSKQDKEAGKPRKYKPRGYMTYGKATKEYAEKVGRPEVMSCAECLAAGKDVFTYTGVGKDKPSTSQCRTSGEMAFYVTELAYKKGKSIHWIPVSKAVYTTEIHHITKEEIKTPYFSKGFIAVFPMNSADIRSCEYDLSNDKNIYIPASAVNAHNYVNSIYKLDPSYYMFREIPSIGYMQLLAVPTEIWTTKLSASIGKTNYVALFNTAPNYKDSVADRHNLLEEALNAYLTDRTSKNNEDLEFFPAESSSTLEPKAVTALPPEAVPDLEALASKGNFFEILAE